MANAPVDLLLYAAGPSPPRRARARSVPSIRPRRHPPICLPTPTTTGGRTSSATVVVWRADRPARWAAVRLAASPASRPRCGAGAGAVCPGGRLGGRLGVWLDWVEGLVGPGGYAAELAGERHFGVCGLTAGRPAARTSGPEGGCRPGGRLLGWLLVVCVAGCRSAGCWLCGWQATDSQAGGRAGRPGDQTAGQAGLLGCWAARREAWQPGGLPTGAVPNRRRIMAAGRSAGF